MADKNSCYTYFRIAGTFEPDEITARLGLRPDRQWRIGDLRKNGTAYDFASWTFGRCDRYEIITAEQMLQTIAPLLAKTDILYRIKQEYDVSLTLEVVPTVHPGESTPCLAPTVQIMQFCLESGTELDIDLYVLEAEEKED